MVSISLLSIKQNITVSAVICWLPFIQDISSTNIFQGLFSIINTVFGKPSVSCSMQSHGEARYETEGITEGPSYITNIRS